MCEMNTLQENIDHLKKSVSRMMVYWVVNSRHDLRDELLENKPDGVWAGLNFRNVFSDDEWRAFFSRSSALFREADVMRGTQRVIDRVHGDDGDPPDWCQFLDELCPNNATLNVMFNAAMTYIDNTDWGGLTSVAQKMRQVEARLAANKVTPGSHTD